MSDETKIEDMNTEDIRAELEEYGVELHHKTGREKLMQALTEVREGKYNPGVADTAEAEDEVEVSLTSEDLVEELPQEAPKGRDRTKLENLTPTEKATRLVRIIVTPNDTLLASYPGLIFTVGSWRVNNGRINKKFDQFNN